MTQKGTHTWDLITQYHRCPKCGNIIESRVDYEYRQMKYQKEVVCLKCHEHFTVTKAGKLRLGPLLGDGDHIEFDWSTK